MKLHAVPPLCMIESAYKGKPVQPQATRGLLKRMSARGGVRTPDVKLQEKLTPFEAKPMATSFGAALIRRAQEQLPSQPSQSSQAADQAVDAEEIGQSSGSEKLEEPGKHDEIFESKVTQPQTESRALEQKAQESSPTKSSTEVAPSPASLASCGGDKGHLSRKPGQYQGEVCTDGSGGVHASHPTLRRCGWAAVWLGNNNKPMIGHSAPLPGTKQTSARAELYAVREVVLMREGPTTIWTDHLAVVNIYKADPRLLRAELLENSDLWIDIRDSLDTPGSPTLRMEWVNSHADEVEDGLGYSPDIPMHIYAGNQEADELARIAAEQHQVPHAVAEQQQELEEMAVAVNKRLAVLAVEAVQALPELPARPPQEPKQRPTTEVNIKIALNTTDHDVVLLPNGSWHCLSCLGRSSAQRKQQAQWLNDPCSGEAQRAAKGMPHHTHSLDSSPEGLVWCVKCGSWSGGVYRALRRRCTENPRTGLQRLCLRRIEQGLKPPGLDHDCTAKAKRSAGDTLFVVGLDASSESN